METEPNVELEDIFKPEERVLLELLSEIRDDWTGGGCKIWIKMKLDSLIDRGNYE